MQCSFLRYQHGKVHGRLQCVISVKKSNKKRQKKIRYHHQYITLIRDARPVCCKSIFIIFPSFPPWQMRPLPNMIRMCSEQQTPSRSLHCARQSGSSSGSTWLQCRRSIPSQRPRTHRSWRMRPCRTTWSRTFPR
jgi:hypothetical protein